MDQYGRNRRWLLSVIIIVLVLFIAAGIWFLKRAKDTPPQTATGSKGTTALPRMANLPPPKPIPTPPTPSYGPNAPVIEQARKALREGIDPAGAVALSKTLPESPERPDAVFLLLEYAAEEGNAVNNFHTIAQGRRDCLQLVGSCDEDNITKVKIHIQIMIPKGMVLGRVQHLQ